MASNVPHVLHPSAIFLNMCPTPRLRSTSIMQSGLCSITLRDIATFGTGASADARQEAGKWRTLKDRFTYLLMASDIQSSGECGTPSGSSGFIGVCSALSIVVDTSVSPGVVPAFLPATAVTHSSSVNSGPSNACSRCCDVLRHFTRAARTTFQHRIGTSITASRTLRGELGRRCTHCCSVSLPRCGTLCASHSRMGPFSSFQSSLPVYHRVRPLPNHFSKAVARAALTSAGDVTCFPSSV